MLQITPNPYVEFIKLWGGVAGFVSISMLLRALYLERSHLLFIHKRDETEQSFVRTLDAPNIVIGTATLIISNNSSRPNAINEWNATVKDREGKDHAVDMLQSTLGAPSDFPPLNVTPIVMPAFSSIEAHLLFHVDVRT